MEDILYGAMYIKKIVYDEQKWLITFYLVNKNPDKSGNNKNFFGFIPTLLPLFLSFLSGKELDEYGYQSLKVNLKMNYLSMDIELLSYLSKGNFFWDKVSFLLGKNPYGRDNLALIDQAAIDKLSEIQESINSVIEEQKNEISRSRKLIVS